MYSDANEESGNKNNIFDLNKNELIRNLMKAIIWRFHKRATNKYFFYTQFNTTL